MYTAILFWNSDCGIFLMNKRSSAPDFAQALSSDVADKRIDILRRLGEVGSISEAARSAGVSYKAAWQALETLSNLAGTPLVEKLVGGSGGGGAQLTPAGRQVLAGAAQLAQARSAVLAALKQATPSAEPFPNLSGLGLRTSMRNILPCTLQSLRKVGATVQVQLDLGDGTCIASRITQESVQLLGLAPGMRVLALCKATGVRMGLKLRAKEGVNLLNGTVTRISHSAHGSELSLQMSSGHQLVGFAPTPNTLKVGMTASAAVEASGVVLALAV